MKPKLRPLLFGLLGLAVLTPLGLLASGTTWGEWGSGEIEKLVGRVPSGLAKLSGLWKALLPDYAIPGWGGFARSALGYVISALLGISLVAGITFVVFKLVIRTEKPAAGRPGSGVGGRGSGVRGRGRLRTSAFRGLRTASRTYAEAALAERLARRNGRLQRANPVLKLLLALGLIVLASLLHNPLPIFGLWLLALVLVAAGRLPIGRFLCRNLPAVLLFGALLGFPALFNWFVPGPAVWTIARIAHPLFHLPTTLAITRPGLHSWLLLTSRVGASVALALLLIWTTPLFSLLAVLRKPRVPAYVIFLLTISYRYVLVLLQEMQNLLQARVSRQLGRLSTQSEQRLTGSGIGWLYLKSRRLAVDLGEAMTSRGFSAQ